MMADEVESGDAIEFVGIDADVPSRARVPVRSNRPKALVAKKSAIAMVLASNSLWALDPARGPPWHSIGCRNDWCRTIPIF